MTRDDAKRVLVADLLQRTASAVGEADLGALRDVCTDALKAKVHHDLAKLPEFREHLAFLSEHIAGQGDEQLVLTLAELGRLHSSQFGRIANGSRIWPRALLAAGAPDDISVRGRRSTPPCRRRRRGLRRPCTSQMSLQRRLSKRKGAKRRVVCGLQALLENVALSEVFECITRALAETNGVSGDARSLRLQRILEALTDRIHTRLTSGSTRTSAQ